MTMRVSSLPGVALLVIAAGSPLMAVKAAGAPQGSPERVVVEVGTVSVRPVTVRSWIPGSMTRFRGCEPRTCTRRSSARVPNIRWPVRSWSASIDSRPPRR